MRRTATTVAGLAAVGGMVVIGAWGPAGPAGAGGTPPGKVGPHQFFVGAVNGDFSRAVVKVVCPGPEVTSGRALPGQTIEVSSPPVVATTSGNTGADGTRIVATIGPAVSTSAPVVFTRYDKPQAFPTDVAVPCGGNGVVTFSPVPRGAGARSTAVQVTYADVAATPGADQIAARGAPARP